MRTASWLLLPILVLVGCGSKSDEAVAESKQRMAYAPVASRAMAAAPMAARAMGGVALDVSPHSAAGRSFRSDVAGMTAAKVVDKDVVAGDPNVKAAAFQVPVPRMIVRDGELTLRVRDVKVAEAQVRDVARGAGGVVEASEGTDLAGPNPSLSITLRVPEPQFDDALSHLEALGSRLGKTISSEDVTAQAVDMDARVKSLRVQEDAYRAILSAARKISDVLEVQEKLTEVRTQIEEIVAQRRGLGDQAARSKIVVSLSQVAPITPAVAPPTAGSGWFAATLGDATGSLFAVGRALASIALWLAVMIPVWLPLGALSWVAYRRARAAQATPTR